MPNGKAIGGTVGAIGGSFIPGVGTAVGGAIGQGVGGLIDAASSRRKSEQATPGLEDPLEVERLEELRQASRSVSAGTDFATQNRIQEIQNLTSSTQGAVSRNTGGDTGGTISGLLRSQQQGQRGINQAITESQSRLPFFQNLIQTLGTRVSQRKLELGLLDRAQNLGQAAQSEKDAFANLNAALSLEGGLPSDASAPNISIPNIDLSQIFQRNRTIPEGGNAGDPSVIEQSLNAIFPEEPVLPPITL